MFLRNIGYAALLGAAAVGFALGSAGTSHAKMKKDAMAAPDWRPIICLERNAPVCGVKGGQAFTYNSACFAARDGAKVISHSACRHQVAKKMKKMDKPMKKM